MLCPVELQGLTVAFYNKPIHCQLQDSQDTDQNAKEPAEDTKADDNSEDRSTEQDNVSSYDTYREYLTRHARLNSEEDYRDHYQNVKGHRIHDGCS